MTIPNKRVAVLSPVAWRTPPRQYGAWETVVVRKKSIRAVLVQVTLLLFAGELSRSGLSRLQDVADSYGVMADGVLANHRTRNAQGPLNFPHTCQMASA
jgi:hypothetical protein